MRDFIHDTLTLIRKEALMLLKDKRNRFILIMPILAQTLLFGYVASYDLNRVGYVLLDEDHSHASRTLIRHFDGSGIFHRVATLDNTTQITRAIDTKQALMALHIGPQFERRLNAGHTVPVQIIVDGRNSNMAGTASGYATQILDTYSAARREQHGGAKAGSVSVSSRAWFNPNLETRWNIISGMIAVLAAVQVMILAAQSVAREKELGTFDQLLVTPFSPITILIGKALPPVLIGIVQSSIVLLLALHWFRIPCAGSYVLLYVGLLIFNAAIVGIGLCISACCTTMQQAMLYSFSLLMPMILLSGFATPIASMPTSLQLATLLNPARYGVELAQKVYLEGIGLSGAIHIFWPLAIMALVTLGAASRLFRKRLS